MFYVDSLHLLFLFKILVFDATFLGVTSLYFFRWSLPPRAVLPFFICITLILTILVFHSLHSFSPALNIPLRDYWLRVLHKISPMGVISFSRSLLAWCFYIVGSPKSGKKSLQFTEACFCHFFAWQRTVEIARMVPSHLWFNAESHLPDPYSLSPNFSRFSMFLLLNH